MREHNREFPDEKYIVLIGPNWAIASDKSPELQDTLGGKLVRGGPRSDRSASRGAPAPRRHTPARRRPTAVEAMRPDGDEAGVVLEQDEDLVDRVPPVVLLDRVGHPDL